MFFRSLFSYPHPLSIVIIWVCVAKIYNDFWIKKKPWYESLSYFYKMPKFEYIHACVRNIIVYSFFYKFFPSDLFEKRYRQNTEKHEILFEGMKLRFLCCEIYVFHVNGYLCDNCFAFMNVLSQSEWQIVALSGFLWWAWVDAMHDIENENVIFLLFYFITQSSTLDSQNMFVENKGSCKKFLCFDVKHDTELNENFIKWVFYTAHT